MKLLDTNRIPGSLAQYSRGAIVGNMVFFSGMVGVNKDGDIVAAGIAEQARTIFGNLEILLEEAGLEKTNLCKLNIYIAEMDSDKFTAFNEVYARWIGDHRPCRTAIGVYSLPRGGAVEIEAIAELA
jgi:2-iminobutanoate/2-iminopropanoate deaminase